MPRLPECLKQPSRDVMQQINFKATQIGTIIYAADMAKVSLDGEPQLVRVAMGIGAIATVLTSIALNSRLNRIRDRALLDNFQPSAQTEPIS